jgi:hypothetical protein
MPPPHHWKRVHEPTSGNACRQTVLYQVAASAVLNQHLQEIHQSVADPLTAAKLGVAKAVKQFVSVCHDQGNDTVWSARSLRQTVGSWLGMRGLSTKETARNSVQYISQNCWRHAQHLLKYNRAQVMDFLSTTTGRTVAQAVARRLYEKACAQSAAKFSSTQEGVPLL